MDDPRRVDDRMEQNPLAGWLFRLIDRAEAEGERLQREESTYEAGVWLAKRARLMRYGFNEGIELNRRDPEAADRFLEEQGLATS